MTDGANQFPWVTTIQEPIAKEALSILRDLVHEFDLGRSGTLRVGGYAHDAPGYTPIGQEDYWRNRRTQVAEMLVNRGVLEAAKSEYVGGYRGAGDETGDFLFVRADEQTVRGACQALEERTSPRPRVPERSPTRGDRAQAESGARPTSPGKAETAPARQNPTWVAEALESRDSFGESFRSTMGKLLAYLTIGLVGLVVVFLLAKFVPGFGDWLIGVLEAVSKKSA